MNNRFKFRAWDKSENAYIEDAQFTYDDGCEGGMGSFRHYSFRDLLEDKNCIVEQCTGLKDRDQKLIYEGDILDFDLSTPRNGGHYRGFIRWQERNDLIGWMISDMDMAGDWDLRQIAHPNDWMVWGRIIGNIHENPELLEFNPEDYDIRV